MIVPKVILPGVASTTIDPSVHVTPASREAGSASTTIYPSVQVIPASRLPGSMSTIIDSSAKMIPVTQGIHNVQTVISRTLIQDIFLLYLDSDGNVVYRVGSIAWLVLDSDNNLEGTVTSPYLTLDTDGHALVQIPIKEAA